VARVRVRFRARGRAAAAATARWRSGRWLGTAGSSPWPRRGALLAVLLAVAFFPYPTQGAPALVAAPGCRSGCHPAKVNMFRWADQLLGQWNLDPGVAGTVPATGTAYAAVADGVAVLGTGLTVYAYSASNGDLIWEQTLSDFPADAAIVSVRSWPGEVTVGVGYSGSGGVSKRTEVVFPAGADGVPSAEYPAALYGGAVAATSAYTVIVGPTEVTSYDNASRKVRWQRPIGDANQGWQIDGQYLFLAESAGGNQGGAPITALSRIDTATGTPEEILPQRGLGNPDATRASQDFDGTLDGAYDGDVLFSAASGVTAYSGFTGMELWSVPGAVPEGADPVQNEIYLARGTTLLEVSPSTGRIQATAPGLVGGMYVVRDGFALGLDDQGAQGAAWGYDIAAERVALYTSPLGWPHYFTDLSGVGGSADPDGDLVVIVACAQAGQPVTATSPSQQGSPGLSGSPAPPSASTSPSASSSASPSTSPGTGPSATASPSPGPTTQPTQSCLRPELVALGL
jgi:outer membrane protein assembly factor BamB